MSSWRKIPAAWLPPSGDKREGQGGTVSDITCSNGCSRAPSPLPPVTRQHRGFSCDSWAHSAHWGVSRHWHFRCLMPSLSHRVEWSVWDDEGPAVTSPPETDPCYRPRCVSCPTGKDPTCRPSSPCHSPRSPSAGWWMLSPGAEWPAKTKTYVILGVAIPAAEPARLWGPSWPLTFIRSVQELRILWEGGGKREECAVWPRKPQGLAGSGPGLCVDNHGA